MQCMGLVAAIATCATVSGFSVGCGGPSGTDYGWFSYTTPEGWTKEEPSEFITYAPTMAVFIPDVEGLSHVPILEIRDVTDAKSRNERNAGLYAYARERDWRSQVDSAERRGAAPPAFELEDIPPNINGPGEKQAISFLSGSGTPQRHHLIHFVSMPDWRRFRVDYFGVDPGFTEQRDAVMASLSSLRFASAAASQSELTLEETVAALQEHLEDDRLRLSDGKVAGQRLNDRHLEALRDPAFAGVTDLNLAGFDARMGGVDVTDEGLEHIIHLPLRSLRLSGSLVPDAGRAQLSELRLEALGLSGTLITGEGLRHLSGMPLETIDLGRTRVDDESLQYLVGMPLVYIYVSGTRVSDVGFRMLEREFPGAGISH